MRQLPQQKYRCAAGGWHSALLMLVTGLALGEPSWGSAQGQTASASAPPGNTTGPMAGMSGHMYMTPPRTAQPGDQAKADAVVAAAKAAMAPYQDYRKAEADGYEIFLPNVPQPLYHFTNYKHGWAARTHFDPLLPTSLLYQKMPEGGYRLVGAMYTDRVNAAEDELNDRIPLSVARWHQHVNFCKAPAGQASGYFGADAKFGLMGSITTREACEAAGGRFIPHALGWMVHVYPYETDPKEIWSTNDHGAGHDNMEHSAMPGMKME
jgi:hypothetical protein